MGGERSATEFFQGLQVVRLPSLTLAHVAASDQKFPDKPFGSVFVRNWARNLWAIAAAGEGEEGVVAIEAKNTKTNSSRLRGMQKVTFTFHAGRIVVESGPVRVKVADGLLEILKEALGAVSIAQLVTAYGDRSGEKPSRQAIHSALTKNPGLFEKEGLDKWRLKGRKSALETNPETKSRFPASFGNRS
jgi:hypothetical protein